MWFRWVVMPANKRLGLARGKLSRATIRQNGRPTIVLLGTIDFRLAYWQRMHHLAHELSRLCNVLYVTPGKGFDRFVGAGKISNSFYVTNDFMASAELLPDAIFLVFSVDSALEDRLAFLEKQGSVVVYDYIDALHEDVDRKKISTERLKRHYLILSDETIYVVSTARALHEEVARHRRRNCALITNGVAVAHYATATRDLDMVSEEYARLVGQGKPLFGFFGSLAVWLDYELLIEVAKLRPDYNWVLIGKAYDLSLEKHRSNFPPNLYVHPRVTYADLPYYAAWFDASILPFMINAVTDATSPLKIFEYMALGKPIVTTPIKEAAYYRSPLMASTPEAFAAQADTALDLARDPAHRALLCEEAELNSWDQKARDLLTLLGQDSMPKESLRKPWAAKG